MKRVFDSEVEVICCGEAAFPDIEVNPLVGVLIKWECETCGKIARMEIDSETIMNIVENILDSNQKIAFWNKEGDWLKEEKIRSETEKECEKRWEPTMKKMEIAKELKEKDKTGKYSEYKEIDGNEELNTLLENSKYYQKIKEKGKISKEAKIILKQKNLSIVL